MEKYGLSMGELGAQRTELLPDRIGMARCGCRRRRARRRVQDCDAAIANAGTGVLAAPILSGNATCVQLSQ